MHARHVDCKFYSGIATLFYAHHTNGRAILTRPMRMMRCFVLKKGLMASIRGVLGIAACAALLFFNYTEPVASLRRLADDVHIRAGASFTLPVSLGKLFTASADDDSLAVTGSKDETLARSNGRRGGDTPRTFTLKLLGVYPRQRGQRLRQK